MSLKVPKAGGPDLFKAGYKVGLAGVILPDRIQAWEKGHRAETSNSICLVWKRPY